MKRWIVGLAFLLCTVNVYAQFPPEVNLRPGVNALTKNTPLPIVTDASKGFILNFPANATGVSFEVTNLSTDNTHVVQVIYYSINTDYVTLGKFSNTVINCILTPGAQTATTNASISSLTLAINVSMMVYCPIPITGKASLLISQSFGGTITADITAFVFVEQPPWSPQTTAGSLGVPILQDSNGKIFLETGSSNGNTDGNGNFSISALSNESILVAPWIYNGINWDRTFYCKNTKFLTAITNTTAEIVSSLPGELVRICNVVIERNDSTGVSTSVKLVEGTGVNCVTGRASFTGNLFSSGTAAVTGDSPPAMLNFGNGGPLFTEVLTDAVCVQTTGVGSSFDVTITYAQY